MTSILMGSTGSNVTKIIEHRVIASVAESVSCLIEMRTLLRAYEMLAGSLTRTHA